MPLIPKRLYKEGVELSVVGCGGVVLVGLAQEEVNALVADSIAQGVNYFDVSPTYGNGEAEEKLGKALVPYRDQVFLACKTIRRDAKRAREELETSLARLRTDHFDLYQAHAIEALKDVDQFAASGGALDVFQEARQKGLTRFLGFSAHCGRSARALLDRAAFDSVLFPVNYVCYANGGIGPELMQLARERDVARLAIKALAHQRIPRGAPRRYANCWYDPVDDPGRAEAAFRFTLSEDITATQPPGDLGLYKLCLTFAARFKPLTSEERSELLAEAAGVEPIFK